MASALARVSSVAFHDGQGLTLNLDVAYSGTDVTGGSLNVPVEVLLDALDQPAAIRTKMSASVSAVAASNGFQAAGANMILPTFQKG